MPQFEIETNDGRVITVESDTAPTQEQALTIVRNMQNPVDETTEPVKDPRNITLEEFRLREEENAKKSIGEDVADFAGGVASGIGQMFSMGASALGEVVGAVSDGEISKVMRSLPEGVARSIFDMGEIGEAIGGRIGDQFVSEEQGLLRRFDRHKQDFLDADRRAKGFTADADEVLPNLTEVASIFGDLTNLIGLGVAGKVAKASKLGKTAESAGKVLDAPSKAVKAGLRGAAMGTAKATSGILSAADLPLRAVGKVGGVVGNLASKPRNVSSKIIESTLGLKKGGLGGVSTVGQVLAGPAGSVLLGTEVVGKGLANLYKHTRDAQKIAQILGNPRGRLNFLQEIATHPGISMGIRRVANLGKTQKGMDIAMNAVSNGVSAGVLQGIFTKLATDDLSQIGSAVGGGMAFGGMVPVGGKMHRAVGGDTPNTGRLPVSIEPKQRARDLEALERERQANPDKFNNEKENLDSFVDAFDSKPSDAGKGMGNEGTTFPAGAKELYHARDEAEGVGNMNEIENVLQGDEVSNVTYVKTGAHQGRGDNVSARKQVKSQIETITQDVALLDIQIPSGRADNMTLTNVRGINVDVLRQIANDRGIDMNFLLGELVTLKTHVRNGGKASDPVMKENSIMQFLGEGETSLMVQIEPRNIVNMNRKSIDSAITDPFVSPPIPKAPVDPLAIPVLAPGEKPTPKSLKKHQRAVKKRNKIRGDSQKPSKPQRSRKTEKELLTDTPAQRDAIARKEGVVDHRDVLVLPNGNIKDFSGNPMKSKSLPRGRGERITSRFKTGVDRSLYDFHKIRFRKSNAPTQGNIVAEQKYLAKVYEIPFKDVPRLAESFHEAVKQMGKELHKKGQAEFNAIDPRTLL